MQVSAAPQSAASERIPAVTRLLSLDVFRGGTMAAMVLVNNQASPEAYRQLEHAAWHGWTFTDLVFPSFLWIVGLAMTLSLARRVSRGDDPAKLLMHIVRRSLLIFLIGVLMNGFPQFQLSTIRIPGVLQRIAICYLAAGSIFLYFGTRARLVWLAALLATYWILMMTVPVPACGAGSFDRDCNLEKWVDGMILSGHMYSRTKTWDPEGIISTLPAICNTLLGIFAGQILASRKTGEQKSSWLFLIGNVLIFAGMMLSTWMPINKQLWTDSYALFSSGIAFVVFASCYWLIDLNGFRSWTRPFTIFGVNALAVYIFSGLIARLGGLFQVGGQSFSKYAWQNVYEPLGSAGAASLLYGLTHVAICFLFAWFLYRRNWYLRV